MTFSSNSYIVKARERSKRQELETVPEPQGSPALRACKCPDASSAGPQIVAGQADEEDPSRSRPHDQHVDSRETRA